MAESGKFSYARRNAQTTILKENLQGYSPGPTAPPGADPLHDTGNSKSRRRMDIPRGRFRALKRNTCLLILLPELHATAFTGYCWINLGGNATILVFDKGKIILAEYDDLEGDIALDLLCTRIYGQAEVLLNDLDDGQIRLALEFNPSCKVSMERALLYSFYEQRLMPAAEPVGTTMNRKTDIPDIKIERDENVEVSVSVEKVQETDEVHSPITEESNIFPKSSDIPELTRAPGMLVENARESAVHAEIIGACLEAESQDESTRKKALRLPVEQPIPVLQGSLSDYTGVSATAGLPVGSELLERGRTFDLLSPDSGLLEDKPVRKSVHGAKFPEPAEQWKFMSVNRGQNTSV
jgi:hypothetical protein